MGLEGKLEDGTTIELEGKYLVWEYLEADRETEGIGLKLSKVEKGALRDIVRPAFYEPPELPRSVEHAIAYLEKRRVRDVYAPRDEISGVKQEIWDTGLGERERSDVCEEWAELRVPWGEPLEMLLEAGIAVHYFRSAP